MEPWGTPCVVRCGSDTVVPMRTIWLLPDRELLSQSTALLENPNDRSFMRRSEWSMLSKALERSNRTNAVICFRSIDSNTVLDIKMFNDSVECNFLLPLWWFVSRFSSSKYVIIWFNAMRSHTFEAAGNSDTGRLLVAISGSPSFRSGTTSDLFQRACKKQFQTEKSTLKSIFDFRFTKNGQNKVWEEGIVRPEVVGPQRTKMAASRSNAWKSLRQDFRTGPYSIMYTSVYILWLILYLRPLSLGLFSQEPRFVMKIRLKLLWEIGNVRTRQSLGVKSFCDGQE